MNPTPTAELPDESGFLAACLTALKRAGTALVETALELWYAAQAEGTPTKVKLTIYGALAYFVCPFDAIPDVIPVFGYSDDAAALAAAMAVAAAHITPAVKAEAKAKLRSWGFR